MRTFYTDYVRHALRFYSRNCIIKPQFKTEADKRNWVSCDMVLNKLPADLKEMLVEIYGGHDTLADEVYNSSTKRKISQNKVWDLMKVTEQKIASKRGLI